MMAGLSLLQRKPLPFFFNITGFFLQAFSAQMDALTKFVSLRHI